MIDVWRCGDAVHRWRGRFRLFRGGCGRSEACGLPVQRIHMPAEASRHDQRGRAADAQCPALTPAVIVRAIAPRRLSRLREDRGIQRCRGFILRQAVIQRRQLTFFRREGVVVLR